MMRAPIWPPMSRTAPPPFAADGVVLRRGRTPPVVVPSGGAALLSESGDTITDEGGYALIVE